MIEVDTVIVGGGISGLACGKELYKAGKDFVLLTEEIGGRMLTSKTYKVDYGASYITSEYKNVSQFIDRGELLKLKDLYFFDGEEFNNSFFILKKPLEVFKLIKFIFLLNDFRKRLRKLREKALFEEQKKILKNDTVLSRYLSEDIETFIKRNKFEYLNETYFNPVLNSTVFVDYKHTCVFFYLACLMPLMVRTYTADFRHTVSRMSHGWKEKIKVSSVHEIKKESSGGKFIIKTSTGEYSCTNVVIALPYKQAHGILKIPKPKNPGVPIYVFHVVGKREEAYLDKKIVFFKPEHHDITVLWRQETGSDIIFSKVSNPNLQKYYEYSHIVKEIHWDTAVVLSDDNFVDQKLEDRMFLASDYNITGLEDSYITGVYAANKIMGKSKD